MKIKGWYGFIIMLLIVTGLFLLIELTPADSDNQIEITNYYADITIDNDGDMTVYEKWDINYLEQYNVRFRDIEYDKFPKNYPLPRDYDNVASFNTTEYSTEFYKDGVDKSDSATFGYSFKGDYDEQLIRVQCPDETSMNCESFFTNAMDAGYLKGEVSFVYHYTIEDVITEYSDISELNWTLFEYAENTVQNGQIDITLPTSFSEYNLYHPLIDLTNIVQNDTKVSFEFSDKTNDQPLAFRLLVPTSTFSDIAGKNTFIDEGINKQIIVDFEENIIENEFFYDNYHSILYGASLIISLIIGFSVVFVINRTLFRPHDIIAQTNVVSPPSKHSPAIVGYLYSGKYLQPEHIGATLLDLIHRGYLTVNDDNLFVNSRFNVSDIVSNERQRLATKEDPFTSHQEPRTTDYDFDNNLDVMLVLNKDMDTSTLTKYEKVLITKYIDTFGDGEKVSLKEVQSKSKSLDEAKNFLELSNEFTTSVAAEASQLGYYDKEVERKKQNYLAFAGVPLIILVGLIVISNLMHVFGYFALLPMIVTSIYIVSSILLKKRRSAWGEKFYQDWNAYKENLENQHILKSSNISDVEYWDKNLVYATTFDIAEKVLDNVLISVPREKLEENVTSRYSRRGHNRYTHYYLQRQLTKTYSRTHQRAHSTFAAHTKSSSRSGGGSFSGGGGGGRSR